MSSVHREGPGDVDGNALVAGDIVEVDNMDDPTYDYLLGVRGVIEWASDEVPNCVVVLQHDQVPAMSTQQYRLRKVE